ncbi:proline-rich protein 7 [Synchiropus splendidus]|uniref:proline-rich protein 7 n=1 Tax=Synchiropus splendidus TaxID=270530 RepID=UPI00237D99FA|nr:proline-rich protein 7 [Synchiropus splendidus]XP_053702285.1 proline-rich protein 7 [Synchiropus splendidus]XP_053702286.1 proline-rich protein 7 [Synchiropus splendidus]XP_053702288.1 proline-rich protein 7 [Synchiropus splendidus]
MVMSQGTYTFLACFAGFWLIWAVVVLFCCFCSFMQRRLKRLRERRLREQCLRSAEMEPLNCPHPPAPPAAPLLPPSLSQQQQQQQQSRDAAQILAPQTVSPTVPLPVPHPMPEANWVTLPDTDAFGKPPCYEEAVLMEDPPPPYSEVLADPRAPSYVKPAPLRAAALPQREHPVVFETSKSARMFPDRGYSSLIRLPSSQRWDSLGHLLSNMELNHYTPPGARSLHATSAMATMPRRDHRTQRCVQASRMGQPEAGHRLQGAAQGCHGGIHGLQGGTRGFHVGISGFHGGTQSLPGVIPGLPRDPRGIQGLSGLEPSCGLPTAFPLLGRSTAV